VVVIWPQAAQNRAPGRSWLPHWRQKLPGSPMLTPIHLPATSRAAPELPDHLRLTAI